MLWSQKARVALGLFLHQIRVFSLAVVDTQPDRTLGELLTVRLFFENLESGSTVCQLCNAMIDCGVHPPLLVVLALGVRLEVVVALKPF